MLIVRGQDFNERQCSTFKNVVLSAIKNTFIQFPDECMYKESTQDPIFRKQFHSNTR